MLSKQNRSSLNSILKYKLEDDNFANPKADPWSAWVAKEKYYCVEHNQHSAGYQVSLSQRHTFIQVWEWDNNSSIYLSVLESVLFIDIS